MKSLKKKTTKIVTLIEEWDLSNKLYYVRTIKNDRIISNELVYKGKKINNYPIFPILNNDLTILKQWNPFWGDNKEKKINGHRWINYDVLPSPHEIDVKNIIFVQPATHRFYDINLEPIPVVVKGDYIEAGLNDEIYDLKKLKKYLENHKNVVFCSEILNIPYYNSEEHRSLYLDVLVYPEKSWLKILDDRKKNENVFTSTHDITHPDFLNIRQFQKER